MNDFACTHSHTQKQTNIQNDGWERVGVLNRERAYKVDVPGGGGGGGGATKTCTAWVMLFQTRVIEEAPFIKVAP